MRDTIEYFIRYRRQDTGRWRRWPDPFDSPQAAHRFSETLLGPAEEASEVEIWQRCNVRISTLQPKKEEVPADFEVRPLLPGEPAQERATCGACGRSWDDAIPTSYTPAPSARCPFEAWH